MQLKLVPFQNVAASQTATLDLKPIIIGKVLDRVVLVLGGTSFLKTHISDIRIKANGKIIWQDTGDRTDKRNQYRGLTASAAFLTIDLSEIRAKDMLDQKLGSMDLSKAAGIDSLTMEVDIGAATAPTLAAYAECSWQNTQVAQAADLIGKVLTFPTPVTASATKFPLSIPYGEQGGSLIKRIHLVPGANVTINGFEVRKNGVTIHDSTLALNNFLLGEYQRVPQTGWYHFDPIADGNFLGNILNAAEAESMEYYADITVTAASTITTVVEMLDLLRNN